MLETLAKFWWVPLVRGIILILLGVVAFMMPGVTLAVLIIMYGAYALVDGAFAVAGAITGRTGGSSRWAWLLIGVVGIIAGVVTFTYPGLTAVVLLYIVAAWAIARGVMEIIAAIQLRKEIEGEFFLGLAGVCSILFGLLLVARPGAGILAVLWILGIYAVIAGVALVGLSLRLKKFQGRVAGGSPPAAPVNPA